MLHRLCIFSLACASIVLSSGIVYGWAMLRPLMQDPSEGYFVDSRTPEEDFGFVSTVGIAANALCKLPLGILLDKYGPRMVSMLGGALLMVGALVMAIGDRNSLPQIASGYFLIGIAGPCVQAPCFQFAELFGNNKGTAMSTLVIFFEISTGVFAVFSFLHRAGATLLILFLGLACVGLWIILVSLAFWPDVPSVNPTPQQKRITQSTNLQNMSLRQQVFSGPFIYAASFCMVHVLRGGWLLATVGPRSDAVFGVERGHGLEEWFGVILPLGFVPMALFTAVGLANKMVQDPMLAFVVINALAMAYGLLLLLHVPSAYIACFVLFPFVRQLVFSITSVYLTAAFGYRTFGRLSGMAFTTAGMLQMLVQNLLLIYISSGNPSAEIEQWRWYGVDLILGVLPVTLLIPPLVQYCSEMHRKVCVDTSPLLKTDSDSDDSSSSSTTRFNLFRSLIIKGG